MTMKYFGTLKDVSFNKSNEKELIDLLLKQGLSRLEVRVRGLEVHKCGCIT